MSMLICKTLTQYQWDMKSCKKFNLTFLAAYRWVGELTLTLQIYSTDDWQSCEPKWPDRYGSYWKAENWKNHGKM